MWALTWVAHGRPYRVGMLVIHSSQDHGHDEPLQSSEGLHDVHEISTALPATARKYYRYVI